jgi:hypothetical protein
MENEVYYDLQLKLRSNVFSEVLDKLRQSMAPGLVYKVWVNLDGREGNNSWVIVNRIDLGIEDARRNMGK